MECTKSNLFTFGGIPIIHRYILDKKLIELFTQHLGKPTGNAIYQYSDIILSKLYTCFIGGEPCNKTEASHSYKKEKGFFPGFATISVLRKQRWQL